MGEISDMHLDGTLCESCGVYMGEGYGYSQCCADCHHEITMAEVEKEFEQK